MGCVREKKTCVSRALHEMRCKRVDSLSVGADGIMTLFEDVRGRSRLESEVSGQGSR